MLGTLIFIVVASLISYLIGSFSSSVWVGTQFYNTDPREHGSGNAGATNTFRVLGKKAGWVVMLMDTLKGFIAASLPIIYMRIDNSVYFTDGQLVIFQLICGLTAVAGHIFPVYYQFKGGKGVATLLGMIFAIHTEVAFICLFIFLAVLILSKYVSLGSMIASFAFPVLVSVDHLYVDARANAIMTVFGIAISCIVVWTHQKNIKRLINGTENKTRLIKKKD